MTSERKSSIHTFDNDDGIVEPSRDLDKYGVWVKSAPQILSTVDDESQGSSIMPLPENEEDLLDALLLEPSEDFDLLQFPEEEPLNDTSKIEDSLMENPGEKSNTTEGENLGPASKTEPIPALEQGDVSALLSKEGSDETLHPDATLQEPVPQPEEDTAGKESQVQFPQPADEAPPPQSEGLDISIQLLRNIIEELSLIRTEILSIKQVLSNPVVSAEKPGEAVVCGSSSEGEHEKITLTGHELNNIFNAPDFTDPVAVPLSKDPLIDDLEPTAGTFIVLEDTEEFRRLKEEGDKPITESSDDGLIDNLLIESGSIKDIPIELNQEEEGSREAETNFNMGEALGSPGFMEAKEEPFDISHFLDEQPEISDEELDRIERNILQEFSTHDDGSKDAFSMDSRREAEKDVKPWVSEDKKKREPSVEDPVNDPAAISFNLKEGLKTLLPSIDQLLESLPDDKVEEFEKSTYFDTYKKLFHELGLT